MKAHPSIPLPKAPGQIHVAYATRIRPDADTVSSLRKFQGVGQIVAFNWHWFVAGGTGLLSACVLLVLWPFPRWMAVAGLIAAFIGGVWTAASLVVSYWIYDRSPLRKWRWIPGNLVRAPRQWVSVHCGLDESSATIQQLFPESRATVLDIFDSKEMTEVSIARARKKSHQPDASMPTDFRQLPVAGESTDTAFIIFAAHELRRSGARESLFKEIHRILGPGGEAVVVEHLRDGWNFCAFGPGFFHFYGRREWLRVFGVSGLDVRREFRITPFVRIFILRRP